MFQLGWLNQVVEFTSQPGSAAWSLVGHTNFGGGFQALRLIGTPSSQDTYIWFNHVAGIHSQTQEGVNQVIVTTRPTGTGYAKSLMVAKLGVGGTYNPGSPYPSFRVVSIENGSAQISFDLPSTPGPVMAPTSSPIQDPTSAPVPSPTPAPIVTLFVPPLVTCPTYKVKKASECPVGCVFQNKFCRPIVSGPSPVRSPTTPPSVCPFKAKKASLCPSGTYFSNKCCYPLAGTGSTNVESITDVVPPVVCSDYKNRRDCPTSSCKFTGKQCINRQ